MERNTRRKAVSEMKRGLILEAARDVFAEEGIEGASLRAVATRAGYSPAALYFHFDSKEALYAELLTDSLRRLAEMVEAAATLAGACSAEARLRATGMAFFGFYRDQPRDLDLGFYLFRGGMKPAGLGRERDLALNVALERALAPLGAAAEALGASTQAARLLMVDCFAHAAGLLLLLHTGRIRMFGAAADERMARYLDEKIDQLRRSQDADD